MENSIFSTSSEAVPAHNRRSTFVPDQSFWNRWLGIRIVGTARIRTALIIAIRGYERDCITPRARQCFAEPEAVTPCFEGYRAAINEMFPEIPGVRLDADRIRGHLVDAIDGAAKRRRCAKKEGIEVDNALGTFKSAAEMADILVSLAPFVDESELIIHDWFGDYARAMRRESLKAASQTDICSNPVEPESDRDVAFRKV